MFFFGRSGSNVNECRRYQVIYIFNPPSVGGKSSN
jgi:hypothetical protein